MIDWDDVRYFLAVARGGSVRAAANRLNVDHSTVLRRVAQLEKRLGARVFEKLPSGYRLTQGGEEVLALAGQMEVSANQLEARPLGRDQSVRGHLRVTMAPALASYLLMPDFAEFAQLYQEIELDIHSSDDPLNLTNRQADVALRVVYEAASLPQNLHGLRGPGLSSGVYMSRDLLAAWRAVPSRLIRWVVKEFDGIPDWGLGGDISVAEVPFRTVDAGAHLAAVRNGIGMTALLCFVGDADPVLVRVPGSPQHVHGTLWLLTQGETRRTKRVQLFTTFMSRKLVGHVPLLSGGVLTAE